MSIPITGTASISNRLGIIGGDLNYLNDNRAADFNTRILDTFNQYLTTDQNLVSGANGIYAWRDAFRTTGDTLARQWQDLAQATMIQMANDSSPINPPTLEEAIDVLTTQLNASGSGYVRPTVTAVATAGSANVGDATMIVSVKGGDGRQLDYVLAETINCTVTADQGTGATPLQEPIQYLGQLSVPYIAWNWPQGSGASVNTTITNAGSTTLVQNGSFETWSSPVTQPPANWTLQTGTINVNLKLNSSVVLTGSNSAEFAGDGTTLTTIQQLLTLNPLTVYAFAGWVRLSATPGAGVLKISLLDAPAGSVINDGQTTPNTFSTTLTSGVPTASWLALTGFFRTPATLPSSTYLSIGFSTALSSSRSLYLDRVALVAATQLYNGGPFAGVFSGGTPSQTGDSWSIVVANNADNTTFPRLQDRVFQLRDRGLYIPTIVSGGISNGLIA